MTDRRQKYQGLAKIIPNLVTFDLAYLREIGARQWQDCEEAYFVAELLTYISLQM